MQTERKSLSFFLCPGLTSTSPLSITRGLQSHANTISKIWNNKKTRIQNFVVIFKILSLEIRGNTDRCKVVVNNKLKRI